MRNIKTVQHFKLSRHRSLAAIARRTRDLVDAGTPVRWVSNRDSQLRAAVAMLGDWQAPYGTWTRVGDGRSVAYFAPSDEPTMVATSSRRGDRAAA